jgi:hypothetical protein
MEDSKQKPSKNRIARLVQNIRQYSDYFKSYFGAFAILCFLSFGGSAEDSLDASKKFDQLTNAYLNSAFGFGNNTLIKFDTNGSIKFRMFCNPQDREKCSLANKYVSDSVGQSTTSHMTYDKDGPLEIVFSGFMFLPGYQIIYTKQYYAGQLSEADDQDCQLYYELDVSRSLIKHASIIVSFNAPPEKIRYCLASQHMRVLGLTVEGKKSFSQIWKSYPDLVKITDREFKELVHSYALLEFIHMCPAIKAGMTKQAVRDLLKADSICFRDLDGPWPRIKT